MSDKSSNQGVDSQTHNFVGVEETVKKAIDSILIQLPRVGDAAGSTRIPPLVMSSFAQSGKTTILMAVFEELKKRGIWPIITSFENSRLSRRMGESDRTFIARGIACVLTKLTKEEKERAVVDEAALLQQIFTVSEKNSVVILIDDLDNVSEDLDNDARAFLCKFLDHANTYLMFTTQVMMDLDPVYLDSTGRRRLAGSSRGVNVVSVPMCTDLELLRGMSEECATLTAGEVMYYGANPALIYSAKHDKKYLDDCIRRAVEKAFSKFPKAKA